MTQQDDKLQYPIICNIAKEVWKTKEAKMPESEDPKMGDAGKRGILLEAMSATLLLMAGADVLIMRHPEANKLAREIIAEAQGEVMAIRERVKGLPPKKVFLQVGATPLFASVETSFTNDFIVLAGGINIAAGRRDGHYNYEMVTAQNPDVIIVAIMGSEGGMGAREKEEWLRFTPISAVRNGQVFVMDSDLICSPSPMTFVKGLEKIAELIHPVAGK